MNSWYTVKVKYTKQLDDGTFKRVTEPYLIAAMTHGEAEERIYEELGSVVRGEFLVTGIVPANIHDVFHYEDSDVWYKAVIKYDSEEGGKSVKQTLLVSAHSVKNAYERIQESLSGMMIDYTITGCILSPIVDIFPFNDTGEKQSVTDRINTDIQRFNNAKLVEKWAKLLDGRQRFQELTHEESLELEKYGLSVVLFQESTMSHFGACSSDFFATLAIDGKITVKQDLPYVMGCDFPHKTFRIFEDMELYGTGIVFHVNDLI